MTATTVLRGGVARVISRQFGFTLTELAVVLAIVGLLIGSLMYTLSAQSEQRSFEETRRRLETARELLLSYAIVNGRLPCSAIATSSGDESVLAGNCTNPYDGFLPARTIGFQITDTNGFAIDAWTNRIRYAVSSVTPTGCTVAGVPHFTNSTNLKANGIACRPADLIVCRSATGITAADCGPAANQVMSSNLVAAIVFSVGKNFASAPDAATAIAAARLDEAANLNADRVFVFHTPIPESQANQFDDQLVWLTAGELYGKLIAAGVLP